MHRALGKRRRQEGRGETEGQGVSRRERPGFDAMVGNPPWDKIRPYQKEFFARFDPAIRDFQGQSLKRRIGQLAPAGSEPLRLWFWIYRQTLHFSTSTLAKKTGIAIT